MKRGSWSQYTWNRDEELPDPEETGAYLVKFDTDGHREKRVIWFFKKEGSFAAALDGIKPASVEGPLPGSRVSEWPKHFYDDDAAIRLVEAVVSRARKDAAYTGYAIAGVKHRNTARNFLSSFPLGRKALAEIDSEIEFKRRKKENKG